MSHSECPSHLGPTTSAAPISLGPAIWTRPLWRCTWRRSHSLRAQPSNTSAEPVQARPTRPAHLVPAILSHFGMTNSAGPVAEQTGSSHLGGAYSGSTDTQASLRWPDHRGKAAGHTTAKPCHRQGLGYSRLSRKCQRDPAGPSQLNRAPQPGPLADASAAWPAILMARQGACTYRPTDKAEAHPPHSTGVGTSTSVTTSRHRGWAWSGVCSEPSTIAPGGGAPNDPSAVAVSLPIQPTSAAATTGGSATRPISAGRPTSATRPLRRAV